MKDELPNSKQDYVSEILKALPKFKDGGCPFQDKRKQVFKGMKSLDNGDKYQGTWVTGDGGTEIIHGRGIYVYANGSQCVGWFYEGKIVGTGRLIFYNGDMYEGPFDKQMYNGHGKYTFNDTHTITGHYEGEFKDNKMTGEGQLEIVSQKPLTKIFGKVKLEQIK